MQLKIGRKKIEVANLSEARSVYTDYREKMLYAGKRGSDCHSGIVETPTGGFHISFNGRVWYGVDIGANNKAEVPADLLSQIVG
jgi:uncharacterized membrane protein